MSIRKTTNHGRTRCLVDIGKADNGRRLRKFFPTRDAAEAFHRAHRDGVRKMGVDWAHQFDCLTVHEKAEILSLIARAGKLGFSLRDLVEMAERNGRAVPSASLDAVLRAFLTEKETRGLRPRTLRKVRATLEMFATSAVRERPIRAIVTADVHEFLHCNGWAAATRKSYLGDLRTFFTFAVKRKFLAESPADGLKNPILGNRPPGIVTVPQVRALLNACQREMPSLLAWLTLCLFAGLRPEEARRLVWEAVTADHIEITARKAKTRRRRLIDLTPQLRAWLAAARKAGAERPPVGWQKKWAALRRAAGLLVDWPQNAMRHTFASSHLAKHRNPQDTALLMGNPPQMLFAHHRELVRADDGDTFFGLLPDAAAVAEDIERERHRWASVTERRRVASAALWAGRRKTAAPLPAKDCQSLATL